MVFGGALVPVPIVAVYTGHELLRVPMLNLCDESGSGRTAERRRAATLVADQHVVADYLVCEPVVVTIDQIACGARIRLWLSPTTHARPDIRALAPWRV